MTALKLKSVPNPAVSGAALVAKIAAEHGYHVDALRGRSQDEGVCRARARAMKALRDDRDWTLSRIGVFFGGRSRKTVWAIINAHREREKTVSSYLRHPEMVQEVEAQMRRITGVNITLQVGHELGIATWQAIFLSILMEAYPNVKTSEQIMEAYEGAAERLYQAESPNANDSQIRTFCFHIRKRFTAIGLPDPVTAIRPRGYVLTYEAAVWLHNRFGRPVAIGMRRVG
jgi:hypothetical protein